MKWLFWRDPSNYVPGSTTEFQPLLMTEVERILSAAIACPLIFSITVSRLQQRNTSIFFSICLLMETNLFLGVWKNIQQLLLSVKVGCQLSCLAASPWASPVCSFGFLCASPSPSARTKREGWLILSTKAFLSQNKFCPSLPLPLHIVPSRKVLKKKKSELIFKNILLYRKLYKNTY